MDLLRQGDGRVVVGDGAVGRRVGRHQRDAVVDVQDARGAAGRPDDGGRGDKILLSVDLQRGKKEEEGRVSAAARYLQMKIEREGRGEEGRQGERSHHLIARSRRRRSRSEWWSVLLLVRSAPRFRDLRLRSPCQRATG